MFQLCVRFTQLNEKNFRIKIPSPPKCHEIYGNLSFFPINFSFWGAIICLSQIRNWCTLSRSKLVIKNRLKLFLIHSSVNNIPFSYLHRLGGSRNTVWWLGRNWGRTGTLTSRGSNDATLAVSQITWHGSNYLFPVIFVWNTQHFMCVF
jgi:hypothetical protein